MIYLINQSIQCNLGRGFLQNKKCKYNGIWDCNLKNKNASQPFLNSLRVTIVNYKIIFLISKLQTIYILESTY